MGPGSEQGCGDPDPMEYGGFFGLCGLSFGLRVVGLWCFSLAEGLEVFKGGETKERWIWGGVNRTW